MTKYTIELDEEEIEIVKRIFTDFNHQQFLVVRSFWHPRVAAILKGILDQILNPKYD